MVFCFQKKILNSSNVHDQACLCAVLRSSGICCGWPRALLQQSLGIAFSLILSTCGLAFLVPIITTVYFTFCNWRPSLRGVLIGLFVSSILMPFSSSYWIMLMFFHVQEVIVLVLEIFITLISAWCPWPLHEVHHSVCYQFFYFSCRDDCWCQ